MMDMEKIRAVVAKLRANPKLARDAGIVTVLAIIGGGVCAVTGVDIGGLVDFGRYVAAIIGLVV